MGIVKQHIFWFMASRISEGFSPSLHAADTRSELQMSIVHGRNVTDRNSPAIPSQKLIFRFPDPTDISLYIMHH